MAFVTIESGTRASPRSEPSDPLPMQNLTILGSTGSIGVNTLDVVRRHSESFHLFALTADRSVEQLATQCLTFHPTYAVMRDDAAADKLRQQLKESGSSTEVLSGDQALIDVSQSPEVHTVMAAIVGAAGLLPTLAAVQSGKKVLLANKEALVMAGGLFMDAVSASGAALLPIDSEHNAIFQCLPQSIAHGEPPVGVRKILLTGSGGPFRTWSAKAIANASPEQACKHPNWSMGRKISVDSATLMNKGLEFIEARWLFGVAPEDIQVVIHPQSIIHSMVEYLDGSVLAQLGHPDMRTPIAHALAWPNRIDSGVSSLDVLSMQELQFEAPDLERFPALSLAIAASRESGAATVLNAANEIAVSAFLHQRIEFGQINTLLDEVMSVAEIRELQTIEAVLDADSYARRLADSVIESSMFA